MQDYNSAQSVIKYLDFLHSTNGKIQKQILSHAILSHLPKNSDITILDAGCGPGWLAESLAEHYPNVSACDSSELFIKFAKKHHGASVEYKVANLISPIPYNQNYFDVVILNMVAPDLKALNLAIKNISALIKRGGKLIMTVPNPNFTYPAAEWKRSFLDVLLMRKPKLIKKTPPKSGEKISREFGSGRTIESYYYTVKDYLNAGTAAGLKFVDLKELKALENSKSFDLNYQMQHYPLILLLDFVK